MTIPGYRKHLGYLAPAALAWALAAACSDGPTIIPDNVIDPQKYLDGDYSGYDSATVEVDRFYDTSAVLKVLWHGHPLDRVADVPLCTLSHTDDYLLRILLYRSDSLVTWKSVDYLHRVTTSIPPAAVTLDLATNPAGKDSSRDAALGDSLDLVAHAQAPVAYWEYRVDSTDAEKWKSLPTTGSQIGADSCRFYVRTPFAFRSALRIVVRAHYTRSRYADAEKRLRVGGLSWRKLSTAFPFQDSGFDAVVFHDRLWIYGPSGHFVSDDGVHFAPLAVRGLGRRRGLTVTAFRDSLWALQGIALDSGDTAAVLVSGNGTDWSPVAVSASSPSLHLFPRVAWHGALVFYDSILNPAPDGALLLFGGLSLNPPLPGSPDTAPTNRMVWRSADGHTWEEQNQAGPRTYDMPVAGWHDTIFAVGGLTNDQSGKDSSQNTSIDGQSFSSSKLPASFSASTMAAYPAAPNPMATSSTGWLWLIGGRTPAPGAPHLPYGAWRRGNGLGWTRVDSSAATVRRHAKAVVFRGQLLLLGGIPVDPVQAALESLGGPVWATTDTLRAGSK